MLGLEAAPGLGAQFPHEQPLGFIVLDIVIPRVPAPTVGQSQFLPAGGGVNGAAELLGIHEGLRR